MTNGRSSRSRPRVDELLWLGRRRTRLSRRDMSGAVRLPNVPMSKGVRAVSPITTWTEFNGTCSSSATT